jgi:two-component system, NtrC family, sensor kinase
MIRVFKHVSFRYKIPLRGAILVGLTAIVLSALFIHREYDYLRRDVLRDAESMGHVLAETLVVPMRQDDMWRAYELINAPARSGLDGTQDNVANVTMVLDNRQHIYVSTKPFAYPALHDPAEFNADYAALRETISRPGDDTPIATELPGSASIYVITPIVEDGVRLGTLVMNFSNAAFLPRFYGTVWRAVVVTIVVLAIVLPLNWYWGRRFAVPLVRLADCMDRVTTTKAGDLYCELYESDDEIGRAGAAFRRMLNGLREKEALEKEVVRTERLAALGRLSAGIAHEINNPLGGMLNTISTLKRHGHIDPLTGKAVSLLERGLLQVKETVAALLVEAKVTSRPLSPQDVEDVHTLLTPGIAKKSAHLVWECDLRGPLPLPSTPVRQILINLVLNATQAIEPKGHVYCHTYTAGDSLYLFVKNDGAPVPAALLEHLFEPFVQQNETGNGLGLWVTYQIVSQLGGEISVRSEAAQTVFVVSIPFGKADDRTPHPETVPDRGRPDHGRVAV